MSATDELRGLLDEKGVEWWDDSLVMFGGGVDYYTLYGGTRQHPVGVYGEESNGTRLLIVPDLTPEQAIAATLGRVDSRKVWLLMATDVETGREEVLGVYATKEAAEAAISENRFGFALHNVQRWEVCA